MWPGREADDLRPSSIETTNECNHTSQTISPFRLQTWAPDSKSSVLLRCYRRSLIPHTHLSFQVHLNYTTPCGPVDGYKYLGRSLHFKALLH
jgi:hypothetical protein